MVTVTMFRIHTLEQVDTCLEGSAGVTFTVPSPRVASARVSRINAYARQGQVPIRAW